MFDSECLFCRIASGEIPAKLIHEDDLVVAFPDIAPRAPTHILVVPRQHITSAAAITESDTEVVGRLLVVAAAVAREAGVADVGYRMVTNIGRAAGQTVDHLHFHILGGRPMTWPPG